MVKCHNNLADWENRSDVKDCGLQNLKQEAMANFKPMFVADDEAVATVR